jgi:Putative bacterial sensory transduction regulator
MKRIERLELIRRVLEIFLSEPIDKTFLNIESADHPDDYVQFIFHDGGVLFGEVCSHEWSDQPAPLGEEARKALIKLGFTGGGPRKNYRSDSLAHDPQFLAELVERAFRAAYGRGQFTDPVFSTTHLATKAWLHQVQAWVRTPELPPNRRLVHVTSDAIRDLLSSRGLKIFTDSEGGHMTFWGWEPEIGTEVKLWFKLENDDRIYRVSATSDRPVPAESWTAARERCNEWNCENRWPKAYLWIKSDDDRQTGFIELVQDLPVECGASICMLDDFTGRVIRGSFDFFRWWQTTSKSKSMQPGSGLE